MPDNVKVTGADDVVRAFNHLAKDAGDLTEANSEIGSKVIGDVKRRTRRKSGTLADSWIASPEATKVTFSNPVSYAGVQEFGSKVRNISPTLAVRGAFEDNADAVTDEYARAIRGKAKRAGIRTD